MTSKCIQTTDRLAYSRICRCLFDIAVNGDNNHRETFTEKITDTHEEPKIPDGFRGSRV